MAAVGYIKPFKFSIKFFSVPFSLIGIHFNHCKNKNQIFNFCLFHRLYRGSEVTVGSEDLLLKFFERAYLFKRGQVEHVLTMANFKLKPSLFTPCPIRGVVYPLKAFLPFFFFLLFVSFFILVGGGE